MAITIRQRLRGFEVLSIIGRGGMGEVYLARDTKLKRDVAIKILPDEFSQDPNRLARFQREAEVLASLNHPNAVCFWEDFARTTPEEAGSYTLRLAVSSLLALEKLPS